MSIFFFKLRTLLQWQHLVRLATGSILTLWATLMLLGITASLTKAAIPLGFGTAPVLALSVFGGLLFSLGWLKDDT